MSVLSRISNVAIISVLVVGLTVANTTLAKELTLAHFMSPKHHLQVKVWEPLAEDLAAATEGKLKLAIYPAGQLGSGPAEQYNRVLNGVADIVHGLAGYTSPLFPKTLLIELPGVPRSSAQGTEGLWNAMALIKDEFRRVKPLALFTSADAIIMTRDKPVRSPEDLRGLRIRVPSTNTARSVEAWGATPVSMPISEVYNAAQTGVIDGVLLNASSLKNFKLHEVFNNFTIGVPSTTSVMFLLMNQDVWARLSEEEQAAVDKLTGRDFSKRVSKLFQDEHEEGLAMARSMPGKTVIDLTPEAAAQFDNLSRPIIDVTVADLENRGVKDARKIVEIMGQP
jgi:TRAP-type C4-dicarboxylate transport system substrate-binding protein